MSLRCSRCHKELPEEAFSLDRRSRRGRQYCCKACAIARKAGRVVIEVPAEPAMALSTIERELGDLIAVLIAQRQDDLAMGARMALYRLRHGKRHGLARGGGPLEQGEVGDDDGPTE